MRRELTLCLLKPSLVKNPVATKCTYDMIAEQNFRHIRDKTLTLSKSDAESFYHDHKGKFFFDRLITYICSGPIVVHIMAGENAIKRWRELMGPTKVYKAVHSHPDTIRGSFGLSDTRNAVHGSDSTESAKKEIQFFFPDFSFDEWCQNDQNES